MAIPQKQERPVPALALSIHSTVQIAEIRVARLIYDTVLLLFIYILT